MDCIHSNCIDGTVRADPFGQFLDDFYRVLTVKIYNLRALVARHCKPGRN